MTPWTVAPQAPPYMELSRQEYWSGLPFPSPEDRFPNPGIELWSPVLQADSLLFEPPGILNRLQYPVNQIFFFFLVGHFKNVYCFHLVHCVSKGSSMVKKLPSGCRENLQAEVLTPGGCQRGSKAAGSWEASSCAERASIWKRY